MSNEAEREAFEAWCDDQCFHAQTEGRAAFQAGAAYQRTQAQSAPAGYVMVPVKPNEAILDLLYSSGYVVDDISLKRLWESLLAAAPKAECTNDDSWNCKYCNKTKDCEALKDPRNFAAPKAEQPPVQEPFGWYTEDHLTDKSATTYDKSVADRWRAKGWPVHPLYAASQPVSDAYRIAVDTGLVCAHLGVTNPEDDYETARKKLNDLICWSIQVDRDLGPADALMSAVEDVIDHLNGGFSIHSGQGLHSCLEAAYRAAMGSKGDE